MPLPAAVATATATSTTTIGTATAAAASASAARVCANASASAAESADVATAAAAAAVVSHCACIAMASATALTTEADCALVLAQNHKHGTTFLAQVADNLWLEWPVVMNEEGVWLRIGKPLQSFSHEFRSPVFACRYPRDICVLLILLLVPIRGRGAMAAAPFQA